VKEMLSLRIEQECRYYNRLVKMVQREGLLDIQAGELPRTIMFRLSSLADIPGNKISQLIAAGDFDVSGIECAVPEVRMEEAFIMRAISIAGKARNEGLLAIEEDIDRSAPDDVFEAGLLLVTDGVKRETIAEILDNLVEKETNPWKKKFARAKRDAVLLILAGDSPRMVEVRLTSYFDNYVRGNIEKAVLKD
jgi:flagellar motor component MotA